MAERPGIGAVTRLSHSGTPGWRIALPTSPRCVQPPLRHRRRRRRRYVVEPHIGWWNAGVALCGLSLSRLWGRQLRRRTCTPRRDVPLTSAQQQPTKLDGPRTSPSANLACDEIVHREINSPSAAAPAKVHQSFTCRCCGGRFSSRNVLFRHLREEPSCAAALQHDDPDAATRLAKGVQRQTVAFLVGYLRNAKTVDMVVQELLCSIGAEEIQISRATSSVSRSELLRECGPGNCILEQEENCGALLDVISADFSIHVIGRALLDRLNAAIGAWNRERALRFFDLVVLPAGVPFHAESFCRQRTYNYLLPLTAVDPGYRLPPHCLSAGSDEISDEQACAVVRSLKQTLKTVASSLDSSVSAPEEESCSRSWQHWHNFALPQQASCLEDNKKAIYSMLGSIKTRDLVLMNGEVYVTLSLSGNQFLREQCRRLVASIVCVHQGWLPPSYLRVATMPGVHVSTPVSPAHLLSLRGVQFEARTRRHRKTFNELNGWLRGESGFSSSMHRLSAQAGGMSDTASLRVEWEETFRAHVANEELKHSGERGSQNHWLHQLETVVAPRIRAELESTWSKNLHLGAALRPAQTSCPDVYRKVLHFLRQAWTSADRPPASRSRARLIDGCGSSFSVANTNSTQAPPIGNKLFPELAAAVFELERLIGPADRPPSAMAALTHNATFKPHTDGGTGSGQSLSMIVGLGDYAGGELSVEGVISDIRYRPLYFDGWRQMHFTMPFQGERFSIVWFTPHVPSFST